MYVVKNSSRALSIALIPLAAIYAVLTAMALLGAKAAEPADLPSPDMVLVLYATQLAIATVLLYAGHRMLRQMCVFSRFAYSAMGGVMAAAGYAIAIRNGFQLASPGDGTLLTVGLLPTIAGTISGFLYGQFAGLEPAANFPKHSYEGLVTSLAFDGPTQVRTSVAAVVIAATMPAVVATLVSISFASLMPGFARFMSTGTNPVIAVALPAQLFLTFLVVTIVPSVILVLCAHYVVRAMNRSRTRDYVVACTIVALACAYLVSPMIPLMSGLPLMVFAISCGAAMGAIYRSLAGLEPVPLPESVIVTDPDALVSADDPARRQHKVVLSN
jgi:hypothetical protein